MLMCAIGVRNGTHTVGDFVMVNAMMIQLYQPLNFMGMVYREIKQAIIDIEKNVWRAGTRCRDQGLPRRQTADRDLGNVRFEDVRFAYDDDRPILKGLSFEVRPARRLRSSVRPARENPPSRGCCSASTIFPAAKS